MATGEQLKALVKSYIDGDGERFFALALQVAAHKARRGYSKLAQEIRELIDRWTDVESLGPLPGHMQYMQALDDLILLLP